MSAVPENEIIGMGEVPRLDGYGNSKKDGRPPWWVWIIIGAAMAQAAWMENTVVTLESNFAGLKATVTAQYASLNQNVQLLLAQRESGNGH